MLSPRFAVAALAALVLCLSLCCVTAQPVLHVDLVLCPTSDHMCSSAQCQTFKNVPTDTCMQAIGGLWSDKKGMTIHLWPDTNDWHLTGWDSVDCNSRWTGTEWGQGSGCQLGATGDLEGHRNYAIISPIVAPCTLKSYNQTNPDHPVCDTLLNTFGVDEGCYIPYEQGAEGTTLYNYSTATQEWSMHYYLGNACVTMPMDKIKGKFGECVLGTSEFSQTNVKNYVLECDKDAAERRRAQEDPEEKAARRAEFIAAAKRPPRFGRDKPFVHPLMRQSSASAPAVALA